jgi:drug/metabolite transporter (DMT)-like permease
MRLLLLVSLLWAISPGLIKQFLGDLPAAAVAAVRLGLTFLVFAPFLRPALLARRTSAWLAGIGAVQFGLMYLLYLEAFRHLKGHEVYLFTILTPLYVVLFDAALANKLAPRHAIAALLSVLGAGVLIPRGVGTANVMLGFLLVQGANLCFAAGQIAYQRTRPALVEKASDAQLFAWMALGGFIVATLYAAPVADWSAFTPSARQWLVLGFLGIVASGGGFFLWNRGVAQVNAGTLAVLNNAKVPLGVAVSLLVFRETAQLRSLLIGLPLLAAAVWLAESAGGKKPSGPG